MTLYHAALPYEAALRVTPRVRSYVCPAVCLSPVCTVQARSKVKPGGQRIAIFRLCGPA